MDSQNTKKLYVSTGHHVLLQCMAHRVLFKQNKHPISLNTCRFYRLCKNKPCYTDLISGMAFCNPAIHCLLRNSQSAELPLTFCSFSLPYFLKMLIDLLHEIPCKMARCCKRILIVREFSRRRRQYETLLRFL